MASNQIRVDAMVIGGGIAGMQSALDLADQGYQVALVEKEASIGGKMIALSKVFPTLDCCSCITTPKMSAVAHHDNIQLYTYCEVQAVEQNGHGYTAQILKKPRYVDPEKCTGCGLCAKVDVPKQEELIEIRGKEISLIPQGLTKALNPQLSIGHQTAEPIDIHARLMDARLSLDAGSRLIDMKRRVLEYLGLVQLADAGIRYVLDPGSFSGGESQRVLIAMALISGPYLVIADEPTSALDVTIQRQIMEVLRMVKDEFNVSTLLISHDAGVIAELSDRVAVMYAGKIQEYGDGVQMFHHPGHPYTMGLMASFPTIAMMRMKSGGKKPRLRGIRGAPPDLTDLPSGCTFHPRCDYCIDICKIEVPEYREVEPRHYVRCHRWGEIEQE